MRRAKEDPLDVALDALASIWGNALESKDAWTMQRAAGVLRAHRERLSPDRYAYPEWRDLVAVPGQSTGHPEKPSEEGK
jgi:hypothetical protein